MAEWSALFPQTPCICVMKQKRLSHICTPIFNRKTCIFGVQILNKNIIPYASISEYVLAISKGGQQCSKGQRLNREIDKGPEKGYSDTNKNDRVQDCFVYKVDRTIKSVYPFVSIHNVMCTLETRLHMTNLTRYQKIKLISILI